MALTEELKVKIVEYESFDVECVEKEIFNTNLKTVDFFGGREYLLGLITNLIIYNEIPSKLDSKTFQTEYDFQEDTLQVFFNGIKEKNITVISNNKFKLPINSITNDEIEVNYLKQY